MKKNKILACLAMAGILAIGTGTYALLSDKTDEAKNVFTIGKGIKGEIYEPHWTGGENGVEYQPNSDILKDPQVKNTSDNDDAYIGIQLVYKLTPNAYDVYNENNGTKYANNQEMLTAKNMTEEAWVKKLIGNTEYNLKETFITPESTTNGEEVAGHWEVLDATKNTYVYVDASNKPLAVEKNKLTEPIFDSVKIIDTDITEMVPFEIHATGYLVQTSNGVDAREALNDLIK